ncbi:MAG: hypothetical protein EBE86_033405 [Hormoscilla sp. GUM202]|nr:hypothetical protein [Hormoscilla sp. GUM202]
MTALTHRRHPPRIPRETLGTRGYRSIYHICERAPAGTLREPYAVPEKSDKKNRDEAGVWLAALYN